MWPLPASDVLFAPLHSALFPLAPGCGFSFPEMKKDAKPTKRQGLTILAFSTNMSIFEIFSSLFTARGNAVGCTLQVCSEKFMRGMNHDSLL